MSDDLSPVPLGQPKPLPALREAYTPFAPPVPAGKPCEAQVLAAEFVRRWFLAWRPDAGAWWQLHSAEAVEAASSAVESGWLGRTEAEVRAFCFGFVSGRAGTKGGATGTVRLTDAVIREAKLLPWPQGQETRNDLTGWARSALKPSDFGLRGISTNALLSLFRRDHPETEVCRRSFEMRLAGAVREAWGHEHFVRPSNGVLDQKTGKRVRGWLGLEARRP